MGHPSASKVCPSSRSSGWEAPGDRRIEVSPETVHWIESVFPYGKVSAEVLASDGGEAGGPLQVFVSGPVRKTPPPFLPGPMGSIPC